MGCVTPSLVSNGCCQKKTGRWSQDRSKEKTINQDRLEEFARYVIVATVEDAINLMDVHELWDCWYDEQTEDSEISDRNADLVLSMIREAVIDVRFP